MALPQQKFSFTTTSATTFRWATDLFLCVVSINACWFLFIHHMLVHNLHNNLLVSHRLNSLCCIYQRVLISFHSPQVGPQPPQQPSGEPQTRFFVLRPSTHVDLRGGLASTLLDESNRRLYSVWVMAGPVARWSMCVDLRGGGLASTLLDESNWRLYGVHTHSHSGACRLMINTLMNRGALCAPKDAFSLIFAFTKLWRCVHLIRSSPFVRALRGVHPYSLSFCALTLPIPPSSFSPSSSSLLFPQASRLYKFVALSLSHAFAIFSSVRAHLSSSHIYGSGYFTIMSPVPSNILELQEASIPWSLDFLCSRFLGCSIAHW